MLGIIQDFRFESFGLEFFGALRLDMFKTLGFGFFGFDLFRTLPFDLLAQSMNTSHILYSHNQLKELSLVSPELASFEEVHLLNSQCLHFFFFCLHYKS